MERTDWNQRYIDADTPWDSGLPSEGLRIFIEEQSLKPCRVLELGCGTGTNAIFLAKAGFTVTAVDLSEEALRHARKKAAEAGASIDFVQADVTALPDVGPPFPFVFDRGTYHIVRSIDLKGLQRTLSNLVEPGGHYLVLAGNANENAEPEKGPPRVTASELCAELEGENFDLVSLAETHFHGIKIEGKDYKPLAWKAVLRRRTSNRSTK